MEKQNQFITLLGPTAVGKTALAARLAFELNGEIISADSRQVFRGMDLGTGKDKADYLVKGKLIPHHLIDIADAGTEFSVYSFLQEFHKACLEIWSNDKLAVMCGGTGLYIEAALKGYDMAEVPENKNFRDSLEKLPDVVLISMLKQMKAVHNTTDLADRNRLVRALEIESYKERNAAQVNLPGLQGTLVLGLRYERATIRKRITTRLHDRLISGMVQEVESLLQSGIEPARLKYYGLEYKFITMFLLGEITYETMFSQLNTAIHQFAKRQMTWFRRMERNGIKIIWLEGEQGFDHNLEKAISIIRASQA